MNTFFRLALYFTFAMLFATIIGNLVFSTDAFETVHTAPGYQDINETNALSQLTGLSGGMESVWLIATTIAGITAVGISILVHNVVPIGIYLFGEVFWTSYIKLSGILSVGGFIPEEMLILAGVGMTMLFIAAIVGMFTGSG